MVCDSLCWRIWPPLVSWIFDSSLNDVEWFFYDLHIRCRCLLSSSPGLAIRSWEISLSSLWSSSFSAYLVEAWKMTNFWHRYSTFNLVTLILRFWLFWWFKRFFKFSLFLAAISGLRHSLQYPPSFPNRPWRPTWSGRLIENGQGLVLTGPGLPLGAFFPFLPVLPISPTAPKLPGTPSIFLPSGPGNPRKIQSPNQNLVTYPFSLWDQVGLEDSGYRVDVRPFLWHHRYHLLLALLKWCPSWTLSK